MKLLSDLSESAEKHLFHVHKLVQEYFARVTDAGVVDLTKHGYHVNPDGSVEFKYPVKLVKHPKDGYLPVKVVKAKSMHLSNQGLTSLENSPQECDHFDCSHNSFLNSLVHAPEIVHSFTCTQTTIHNLVGAPKHVRTSFLVYGNPHLTSLEGLPEHMITFTIDIKVAMPLLRIPLVKDLMEVRFNDKMSFALAHKQKGSGEKIETIVNDHLRQGKPGVFKLHDALVDAGFGEHAKF